jgi:hypothetical protein
MLLLEQDLVAVTESFLDHTVGDAEVVSGGWSIIRRDRGSWGGGVMLAARPDLMMSHLKNLETSSGEDLWASVKMRSHTSFVCVVYIPPSSSDSVYLDWFAKVESFIHSLRGPVIILGDINMNSATLNVQNYYCYFLSFCNLVDRNEIVNSRGSKLDIALTQECVGVVSVSCSECGGLVRPDLYHPPLDITITVGTTIRRGSMQPSNIDSRDWNFRRVDQIALRRSIDRLDWSNVLQAQNLSLALDSYYESIYRIFDETIPKKRRSKSSANRFPVWFTADIIRDIREKLKLHWNWKQFACQASYTRFSNLRACLKSRISLAHRSYITGLESDLHRSPRNFWRHINSLRSGGGFEPSVIYRGLQYSGAGAANAFADHFSSIYVHDLSLVSVPVSVPAYGHIDVADFSIADVKSAIGRLKCSWSPGPDGIPADVLKMC